MGRWTMQIKFCQVLNAGRVSCRGIIARGEQISGSDCANALSVGVHCKRGQKGWIPISHLSQTLQNVNHDSTVDKYVSDC